MPDELLNKINEMIENGDLDPEDSTKLLLAEMALTHRRLGVVEGQLSIVIQQLADIQRTQAERAELDKRVAALEAMHSRYPSLPWLAFNQTKWFLFGLSLFIVAILVIGTPWNVSDVRHVLLDFLGINPTLGLQ